MKNILQKVTGDKMKKLVGVIKDIDENGRITMPKDFRILYGLEKEIEIVPTIDGVLIRNPEYKLVKKSDEEQASKPIIIVTDSEIHKKVKGVSRKKHNT